MLMDLARSAVATAWLRFRFLSLAGKAVTVVLVSAGLGWSLSNLGLDAAGRQVWSVGIFVLSLLLTGLVISLLWGRAGRPGR